MAAQFQPTEEQIDNVSSVTNLSREESIQRLKVTSASYNDELQLMLTGQ
jgi:hypothetical protein